MAIAGVGCAVADFVYNRVDFTSPVFQKYLSKTQGDGGLSPGKLVFVEEFESFSGKSFDQVRAEIVGTRDPDTLNLGGPAIVALISAAQLLSQQQAGVSFYGVRGNDWVGKRLGEIVAATPLDCSRYAITFSTTPYTCVFSDPAYDHGHGERTFVNNIGAAWDLHPSDLPEAFFNSPIVLFGATGLVPNLHDGLTELTGRAHDKGCFTIVSTVYDFRNEKKDPCAKWPLGKSDETYQNTDLLITDHEEALRLSNKRTIDDAMAFFRNAGLASLVVTNGSRPVQAYSEGRAFKKTGLFSLPVSQAVVDELAANPGLKGDTTGCGDNFAGGVLASIAMQMRERDAGHLDLADAIAWGIASGGFACYYMGGTYLEKTPGEKYARVKKYYDLYCAQ
ncbi:MAG: hypothetical protein A2487_09280 [Candidatus Raymondbacteria bacterium RifOxyC12_full_50_8]|uniref:Carbohydrate kinase PfkB domain-containing protein n=1 Tax=Candidatus Raymondbacteria bacterium RIFOXYD12_FULL_49_13 TaxID=1817890 RepID=A0A1F7FFB4_UNCRA|nr:MAG: hypothetical protein A2248_22660 [Candidatus Raymondbacteria bacterium RIFOXYA2_FULL_49_16]OGJ94612.1 MAG: hypothetical protein A2350_06010 [Candidatus Raymondbacteria bacterium RifOxyB12_full_50_8]OGJ98882.1 MAG: hypothetical protein A2487_09280 [Candidatus Raymondbacteria bacterium RifOxyC12_full_50_8]OGK05400.1 MAG: hypothetical protein A2519_03610 [Candidatus Raymondbacteria bacterium RIFOXYD12_FULL_49_13]OGP43013.1 MAG: hypothetical protein A2324_16315 [Candidatus Raymondbacteria b